MTNRKVVWEESVNVEITVGGQGLDTEVGLAILQKGGKLYLEVEALDNATRIRIQPDRVCLQLPVGPNS